MKQTGLTLLVIFVITAIVAIPNYAEAGRKEDNLWFGLGGLAIGTTVGYVIGSQTRKPPRHRTPAPVYYDYYSPAHYSYSYTPVYQPAPQSFSHRGQAVSLANMSSLNLGTSQEAAPEPQPQNITISIGDNASNISINLGKDGQVTENSQPVSAAREGRALKRPDNNNDPQPAALPASDTKKEADKKDEKDESDSDDQE